MKQSRKANRVRKHRRDHNNGKSGFVSGNARYKRSKPDAKPGMGKAREAI
jgi:hypothetical protein